ncbi:MAG: RNase P modulator RnpM [Bulleidia sp.]
MPKKIPMRRCVATGEQLPKKELLRIVRTPEGTLAVDATGKANGRGAYLKKDLEAVEKAKKNGSLARALEVKIPDEFWDTIRAAIR